MQNKNYYTTLGIKNTAGFDEIKIAYRDLAKKYHPDKNQGNKAAEEYFKEVQQAYTVLSNPEKREKYDLSFRSNSNYKGHKYQQPFTGNAYQYAQQNNSQRQQQPNFKNSSAKKQNKSEKKQIVLSISIAAALLYFIISFTKEKELPIQNSLNKTNMSSLPKKIDESTYSIDNFDSPYSYFFGEEVVDMESKNNISIQSGGSDMVVCLVELNSPFRTIRNQYMICGSTFKMNNIPDGVYYLKVYYGTNWDTSKVILENKIKGGFQHEIGFSKLNTNNTFFEMKQIKAGNIVSYSSYEIAISPITSFSSNESITGLTADSEISTAKEFFK